MAAIQNPLVVEIPPQIKPEGGLCPIQEKVDAYATALIEEGISEQLPCLHNTPHSQVYELPNKRVVKILQRKPGERQEVLDHDWNEIQISEVTYLKYVTERGISCMPHLIRLIERPPCPCHGFEVAEIMTKAEGITLSTFIQNRAQLHAFSPLYIEKIFYTTIKAQQELLEHKLMHSDLKPSNMILDAHANITLLDAEALYTLEDRPKVFGTPGFYAPEAYMLDRTLPSPEFATGATIFKIITGKQLIPNYASPWDRDCTPELRAEILIYYQQRLVDEKSELFWKTRTLHALTHDFKAEESEAMLLVNCLGKLIAHDWQERISIKEISHDPYFETTFPLVINSTFPNYYIKFKDPQKQVLHICKLYKFQAGKTTTISLLRYSEYIIAIYRMNPETKKGKQIQEYRRALHSGIPLFADDNDGLRLN